MSRNALLICAVLLAGCGVGVAEGDGELATGEGAALTLDARETRALLGFANACTTTLSVLDLDAGLRRDAARNIVARRDGPDAACGTSDDRPFAIVSDVDDVPRVGPAALRRLADHGLALGFDVATGFVVDSFAVPRMQEAAEQMVWDDEGFAGELRSITDVADPELEAILGMLARAASANAAQLSGRTFPDEAHAVEAVFTEAVLPVFDRARREGLGYLSRLVRPPSDARLLELARERLVPHFRDVEIPSERWQSTIVCTTFETCDARGLTRDIAAFGAEPGAVVRETGREVVVGSVLGLYTEVRFDAVGGLAEVYVEFD